MERHTLTLVRSRPTEMELCFPYRQPYYLMMVVSWEHQARLAWMQLIRKARVESVSWLLLQPSDCRAGSFPGALQGSGSFPAMERDEQAQSEEQTDFPRGSSCGTELPVLVMPVCMWQLLLCFSSVFLGSVQAACLRNLSCSAPCLCPCLGAGSQIEFIEWNLERQAGQGCRRGWVAS